MLDGIENHLRRSGTLLGLVVLTACSQSSENHVRDMCMYLRPDMTLEDANRLIGWQATNNDASWHWTDRNKCIVLVNPQNQIMEVLDFYRYKHYHKLLEKPGVFERDIETTDQQGNPINQW